MGELTVRWQDPAALAERARAMAGLAFLEAIRDGELPAAPIQSLMGFKLVEVEEGRVAFSAEPGEQHSGGSAPYGRCAAYPRHTGVADPLGSGHSTLETKFNLVRAITVESGTIVAEGRVVHRGSRVATAEGRVVRGADGKLLAHGSSTCLVLR